MKPTSRGQPHGAETLERNIQRFGPQAAGLGGCQRGGHHAVARNAAGKLVAEQISRPQARRRGKRHPARCHPLAHDGDGVEPDVRVDAGDILAPGTQIFTRHVPAAQYGFEQLAGPQQHPVTCWTLSGADNAGLCAADPDAERAELQRHQPSQPLQLGWGHRGGKS